MKSHKLIQYIFSSILFFSCSTDDNSVDNGSLNKPPNNFALIQLTNNSTEVSLNPQFTWGRATDPEGDSVKYLLLLDEGKGDPTSVLVSDLLTTNYTVSNSLKVNTIYSWQVIASDGNGGITKSEIFTFITRENQPPANFNLLQVPNSEDNITLKPELSWENAIDPDKDTVSYDILLDTGTDNPITIIADNLQTTSFKIPNSLDHNTLYSWQVIASDSHGNRVSSEIFTFRTRKFLETLVTREAQFSTRTEHTLNEFNGKLWVIGGYHASNGGINGGLLNDVWSSADGVNWIEEVPNDSKNTFQPRTNHTTVVFQNKIWVIGGGGLSNTFFNDVWSSTDGVNWVQETANANFAGRFSHSSVVYNNRIWIIGGRDGLSYNDDVWSSSDGINWTLETNNAAFGPRGFQTTVVFQEKMWVIGGYGSGDLNDVWSSSDGVTWNLETINADFAPRRGHSSCVYKNRIWVIAGNLKNEFWSSNDGINWTQETDVVNFNGRGEQANLVFDDKLWVVGGWMGSLLNDVWFFN